MNTKDTGIRVSLVIDTVLLFAMLGGGVTLYSDFNTLASDFSKLENKAIPERVIRIEEDAKHTKETVDRIEDNQEEMQDDLKAIIYAVKNGDG